MSIDKDRLRELVHLAGLFEWYKAGDLRYHDEKGGDVHALDHADAALIEAASPVAIKALLDEIERLSPPVGQVSYREQMEAWKSASIQDLRARGELMIQVEELEAENETLRKDAERYRWLRDKSESVHQFYLSTPVWFTGVKFIPDNVDNTIDAAMAPEAQDEH